ncbi:SRPBCC family protein [Bradyrhizobium icense]|uniref:ATPase n=1 Tax=Bradyrhizobium icense TaxID=1274631 RepID=A0A1B1UAE8_9BRAD|nr:SRPBCC domain-containing protein [Bradyrhizobium icense]ANV99733.1 ATPase [Bradyrhizobium icense]
MPVKKEPSGRRSVEAKVEVPGTPEEVWQAIATGPGISSWFVPTTLDEKVGGNTKSSFGPGMDSEARITAWEPAKRFVAETEEGPGTVATEWTVEAKDGGTCVVRVVHSWFANTDDWDGQFEGHTYGWIAFFQNLRLYLEQFRGQQSTTVALSAMSNDSDAWSRLVGPLGLADASAGARFATPAGTPELRGVVEVVNPPQWPGLQLLLEHPAPAIAHLFAMPIGGPILLTVRLYLYGDAGRSVADHVEADWRRWLDRQFPPQT